MGNRVQPIPFLVGGRYCIGQYGDQGMSERHAEEALLGIDNHVLFAEAYQDKAYVL